MKNLQHIKNVYFLGIGGIGMSALARYFKHTGRNVAGYDRTPTTLTKALQEEGISVHFDDDIRNIPKNWDPANTLAVFTPALPDEHAELSWFREKPIALLKRAKVLGLICNERNGIAVSGTHGKTTVSTMTATILNKTEKGCGAFLGGISKNFETNLLLPKEESPWIVAEADEFDRSFLHLFPVLALVTSLDADHLDIYGHREKIVESFEKFISQIQPGGKLVLKMGVELDRTKTTAEVFTYALNNPEADFTTMNLQLNPLGFYQFDIKVPGGLIENCKMTYPGLLNVENAIGAAALSHLAGASDSEIRSGLEEYQGVVRRFDIRFRDEKYLYIDDYAHHPEELKATITSVKELYKEKKVLGIFQPHLYSRTRDFSAEFAASLDLLDTAVILPIYPAREEPIRGVTSEIIFNQMKSVSKYMVSKAELTELIEKADFDIVMTMGAGDIDGQAENIIEILRQK